ncbi:MAG TPA: hypothetical protein VFZ18_08905, partial [Longimicrobiaceae bacterium]
MRRAGPAAGAGLVALLSVLGVAALTRVPYDADHAEDAILRLSWRTRGEEVRECRTLSPEELAALPVHMQRTEVCEGRVLSRHLLVRVDGRPVIDDTVRAAGARSDRPLYVYYEIPLSPGVHALHVRFVPETMDATADEHGGRDADDARESDESNESDDRDDGDDADDAD